MAPQRLRAVLEREQGSVGRDVCRSSADPHRPFIGDILAQRTFLCAPRIAASVRPRGCAGSVIEVQRLRFESGHAACRRMVILQPPIAWLAVSNVRLGRGERSVSAVAVDVADLRWRSASYDYAQVNHDGEWLVLQMGVRTDRAQWLRPRDLEIRTPGGGTIEAPTQSDVNRSRTLRPEVHAAGAFGAEALDRLFGCIPVNELSTSGFAGYADRGAACEEVRLWSLYRGPTRNHVAINDLRTARLFVFFRGAGGRGWRRPGWGLR